MDKKSIETTLNSNQYKILLDNFPGNVILADGNGIILYANKPCLTLWNNSPDTLIGQHVSVFRNSGFAPQSGNEYVLENKEIFIKYMKVLHDQGILTVSMPVFGAPNELAYIVTFSFSDKILYEYVKIIEDEKKHMQHLIDFFCKSEGEFVAKSPVMLRILELVAQFNTLDSSLMIFGEAGSGKEKIARHIHETSIRSSGPFVCVHCSAIPQESIEEKFMGFEKGVFPELSQEEPGLFQLANEGTLFLDEIGEIPLSLQEKFLEVLKTGMVQKVGSQKYTTTNVRIIATTNRDLEDMVQKGTFRRDLYYWLTIMPLKIPPLRERMEDIEALSFFFLNLFNKKFGCNKTLSSEILMTFKNYCWPGNVRELKSTIERLIISSPTEIIEIPSDFFPALYTEHSLEPKVTDAHPRQKYTIEFQAENPIPLKEAVDIFQKQYIEITLAHCDQNIVEAAKQLDVSKSGMYKKINEYHIQNKRE